MHNLYDGLLSVSVTPPAGGGSATTVDDYYQLGQLAYQTDGAGTLLASYTYDQAGAPESVQVGSDPTTAPRYYYVYDARGDVVNLTDASGVSVADYSYDSWGALTNSSETIPNANGWVNPYRYDGRDGVRSDVATGLDWMSVRAYDPTLGRFISRDPLGRAPLVFADNPYVYAGNNPLSNVDPSGQYRAAGFGSTQRESGQATNQQMARVVTHSGCDSVCQAQVHAEWLDAHIAQARGIAKAAEAFFNGQITLFGLGVPLVALTGSGLIAGVLTLLDNWINFQLLEQLSIFTIGWAVENMAVVTYDIIAFVAMKLFQNQTTQSDAWWLNPTTLSNTWSGFGFTTALLGTLLTGLSLAIMAISPEFSPIWVALAIGVDVAIFKLLPHVRDDIDQEQQALGYGQS